MIGLSITHSSALANMFRRPNPTPSCQGNPEGLPARRLSDSEVTQSDRSRAGPDTEDYDSHGVLQALYLAHGSLPKDRGECPAAYFSRGATASGLTKEALEEVSHGLLAQGAPSLQLLDQVRAQVWT